MASNSKSVHATTAAAVVLPAIQAGNCRNCGAAIHGEQCEYCGTLEKYKEQPVEEVNEKYLPWWVRY
jgi:methionyl-tRNA synthetase